MASYGFYSALGAHYLLPVIALVTVISYFTAILLARAVSEKGRDRVFWSGVVANLLVLIGMKYLPFMLDNLDMVAGLIDLKFPFQVKGLVFIGVSYYVLQAISYLTDVYLETESPERHPGYFALYLAFFPKLLQGPIERAGDLLPQLKKKYEFNYENMRSGFLLFSWGLFKKVVVANRLELYVNQVYNDIHSYTGLPLILATYLFALQLYCDFSAYTDMAIGTARLFNVELTRNFETPYLATSISDFWRRWHISFSRWILDYIFKPLQYALRNQGNAGMALALIITFLASGIWHGASWCFVIWGGIHGLYMAASVYYRPIQKRLYRKLGLEKTFLQRVWQTLVTFNLICFAWIFFRANSVSEAFYVVANLFSGIGLDGLRRLLLSQGEVKLIIASLAVMSLFAVHFVKHRNNIIVFFDRHTLLRWATYYTLVISMLLFGLDSDKAFIYFQF